MTVGLPGSGLGGVFYLLSALWMPFHQMIRAVRRDRDATSGPAPLRLIARQAGIAGAMIAALFATGHVLGWLLFRSAQGALPVADVAVAAGPPSVLRTAVLLLTAGTLAALLLGVEIASLMLRRRGPAIMPAGTPDAVAAQNHAA